MSARKVRALAAEANRVIATVARYLGKVEVIAVKPRCDGGDTRGQKIERQEDLACPR